MILTINFDPLIERALDQAGISPQIVRSADAIKSMIPLQHAPVTVVKLHGDYTEPGMRNSPAELRAYPDVLRDLVIRVVDEYGLLVVGWSAEWDPALCVAIEQGASRRYPTYWATYNDRVTEPARRLMAWREAIEIPTTGADEFLPDLAARVDQLDFRASRKGQPRALRTVWNAPSETTPPSGWEVFPLLLFTCTIGIEAGIDECDYIREPQRAAIQAALLRAPLTARVYGHAAETPKPATASTSPDPTSPRPFSTWKVVGEHQTTGHASYQLGEDQIRGAHARLSVWLPNQMTGGRVDVGVQVGLSIERRLALHELAFIWRDSLTLAATAIPEALATILPPDANVGIASMYALAAPTDGLQNERNNNLSDRIDLSSLGPAPTSLPSMLGLANQLAGSLTEHDAAALIADSLSIIAYDAGFVAPENGLAVVRQTLGVALRQ